MALLSRGNANGGSANNGGRLYNYGAGSAVSSPQLTNGSFQSNSAAQGGALYNYAGGVSSPQLTNCVLFANGAGNTFFNNGNASVLATFSLFDQSVTGYNTTEPTNLTTISSPFAGPATTQLSANSPAINAGNTQAYINASGPPTDLAQNPRLVGTSCAIDRGAYEVQVGTPVSLLVLHNPFRVHQFV